MERVYSTTALPQRRWGSNSAQDQRVSKPTTFSLRNNSRPMSTLGSRPVSGFSNRPVSGRVNAAAQSRPGTALSRPGTALSRPGTALSRPGTALSRPGTALNKPVPPLMLQDPRPDSSAQMSNRFSRPASAVRPLLGRIFMRKTQDRGWVAKNIPEISYDGLEVEDYDEDHSETQSLDSFFDDDFDTEEQDEKLQRLLTCTTLGVSSKGQNKDWISGEVSVPKFHCPRCRDHYYGLTPFPCDEELARLMREGLWHTGETATSPDKGIRHGMMKASLSSTDTHRNRKSSEGDFQSSSKIKLPPLSTNASSHSQSSSQDNSSTSNTTANKKKKRISFALDNLGADGSPSVSETDLNKGGTVISSGRKRRIGDESRKGSDPLTVSDVGASNSSLDRFGLGAGAQKKSDNQSSTSKLLGNQVQLGGGGDILSKGTSKLLGSQVQLGSGGDILSKGNLNDANHTGRSGSDRGRNNSKSNGTKDALGSTNTNGMTNHQRGGKESTDDGNSSMGNIVSDSTGTAAGISSDYVGGDGMNRNLSDKTGLTDTGGSSAGHNTGIGGTASKNRLNTSGDGKDCNVTSCENKTNSKPSGSSNSRDSGGNVKKSHKASPGYMRAASPTQSDWGDPTHAKKWINNVAPKPTSHFKYNTDDHDDNDEFSSHTTRGSWRNRLKKPPKSEEPEDSLLLQMGPSLTRAFTFSYVPSAKPKN